MFASAPNSGPISLFVFGQIVLTPYSEQLLLEEKKETHTESQSIIYHLDQSAEVQSQKFYQISYYIQQIHPGVHVCDALPCAGKVSVWRAVVKVSFGGGADSGRVSIIRRSSSSGSTDINPPTNTPMPYTCWWHGIVVASSGISGQMLYIKPG